MTKFKFPSAYTILFVLIALGNYGMYAAARKGGRS